MFHILKLTYAFFCGFMRLARSNIQARYSQISENRDILTGCAQCETLTRLSGIFTPIEAELFLKKKFDGHFLKMTRF